MNKPLIIYHADCADGLTAAAIMYRHFGDKADYYAGKYQEKIPDILERDVYLVDFSYKSDILDMIVDYAKSVTIIDHHKSAIDDLCKFALEPTVDMEYCALDKSGAMLTWLYCVSKGWFKGKPPKFVEYVQDRDLWKFKLPYTKEISMAIFSYPMTIAQYVKWLGVRNFKPLISEGETLLRKYNQDLEQVIKQCKRSMTIGGYTVPCANVHGMFSSDAGNRMSEGEPFAATYYDIKDARIFSLRSSDGGVDVSQIALQYGGGGHARAAGFKVSRDHELSRL